MFSTIDETYVDNGMGLQDVSSSSSSTLSLGEYSPNLKYGNESFEAHPITANVDPFELEEQLSDFQNDSSAYEDHLEESGDDDEVAITN